jgi:hypothetical protein
MRAEYSSFHWPAHYVMILHCLAFHVVQPHVILETHVQYDPLWTHMTVVAKIEVARLDESPKTEEWGR